MSFATDRHLLTLEPNLFRDIAWSAQTLIREDDAQITGTTLTSTKADFEAARVGEGHIALVGGAPLEVVERISATQLTVSLLRDSHLDDPIPPKPTTQPEALRISTFSPQIRSVHDALLRALGITPEGESPAESSGASEEHIVNPRALVRAESLGALHLVFTAAAAIAARDALLWNKAQMYRARFTAERRRIAVELDTDGDGYPETVRRVGLLHLRRA